MQTIDIHEDLFRGAISVERLENGWKPWRLPYQKLGLFPPSELHIKAEYGAGVRLSLLSDTTAIQVIIAPQKQNVKIDCVIDNDLVTTMTVAAGEREGKVDGLPHRMKRIELYLPQVQPVTVSRINIDERASLDFSPDSRKRWITYGSSITQCGEAASPALTWPAIIARRNNLHLTCLGYGGQCHLEPMLAMMIRDLPADYISLCMGVNVRGKSSLSLRTYKSAVLGFIQIIREKHRETPIIVISPIYSGFQETNENAIGVSLVKLRKQMKEAVSTLQAYGDKHLQYVDGLSLFGPEDASYLPDDLHPNAEGYQLLAERMQQRVVEPFIEANRLNRST